MSADVVIRAEGLGKKYVIGHQAQRERYVALRDVIARNAKNLGRSAMDLVRGRANVVGDEVEEFWALKDVNFEIKRGEVVGVIGRNGAGKSTLLKVLSRITEPTEGRVEIHGRVASLLEVGTGFHPELTGRENIFLNGAVLGMSHAEIRRKFDEIVAFAEVEKFLDTPVKRYSSGMYVRLAFAVAAHLEPEILIVDEVLAVGDAEFQKKCLGKMGEVAGHGRTVLFVSHNMGAVEALCGIAAYLDDGTLRQIGPTDIVVQQYAKARPNSLAHLTGRSRSIPQGLLLRGIEVTPSTIRTNDPIDLTLRINATATAQISHMSFLFYSPQGQRLAIVDLRESMQFPIALTAGNYTIQCTISAIPFIEGRYIVSIYLNTDHFSGDITDMAEFDILPISPQNGVVPYDRSSRGLVALRSSAAISMVQPSTFDGY